jgi:hypothetical protein
MVGRARTGRLMILEQVLRAPSPEPPSGPLPEVVQFGIGAHDTQGAPAHRTVQLVQLDDVVTITTPATTITTPMARPSVSFSERNSADRISVTAG